MSSSLQLLHMPDNAQWQCANISQPKRYSLESASSCVMNHHDFFLFILDA